MELSDYLLDELTDAERSEFELRLREEPELRAQVARLGPLVQDLGELPPEAWRAVEPALMDVQRTPRPRVRRPRLRLALAVGAMCSLLIAVGVGIGALLYRNSDRGTASTATVVLRPVTPRASRATGTASLDEARATATVRVTGLPPSAPTSYYELWLMNGPNRLVSLGSFRVPSSGTATVSVPLPVDARLFHFVDISLEPIDGGPQHSGISVLRAPT